MENKAGKNAKCHCGSGKKYKLCHMLDDQRSANETVRENQDAHLLGLIDEYFGAISGEMVVSPTDVSRFYRSLDERFREKDPEDLLPKSSNNLRALYLGEISPANILQNICRFGLYVNEILIINPFLQSLYGAGEMCNPIDQPGQFIPDTIRNLFFIERLRPWISSGHVKLVVDPMLLDTKLHAQVVCSVSQRQSQIRLTPEDSAFFAKQSKEQMLIRFVSMNIHNLSEDVQRDPKRVIASLSKELARIIPHDDLQYAESYVQESIEVNKRINISDLRAPGGRISEFIFFRGGASLEMAMYLSALTGCFPYTDSPTKWRELLAASSNLSADAQRWSPLTRAFQALDFPFLNHVDPAFALRLRQDGRLSSFRSYLERVWKSISGSTDPHRGEEHARQFADELGAEYAKARAEWDAIQREVVNFGGNWVGGALGLGGAVTAPIVTGHLKFIGFGAAAAVVLFVNQLLQTRGKKADFKLKNPMSIFIELANKK